MPQSFFPGAEGFVSTFSFQPRRTPLEQASREPKAFNTLLARTNFLDGRLLTATDLTREQTYLEERVHQVGRVLGDGVVRGLELSPGRQAHVVHISPGLGVAPNGRVIELRGADGLDLDLGDRAHLRTLNDGGSPYLESGLWAVVLRYAERSIGTAEVFPTDLGSQRKLRPSVIQEGVEPVLVRLPIELPRAVDVDARARLARAFFLGRAATAVLPGEGVALGVIAIARNTLQWLDADLLRHPLRRGDEPGVVQGDLRRHYESLLDDVVVHRRAAQLSSSFAAREHFQLLPPAGRLPKSAFDPEQGLQTYFPEDFDVSLVALETDDLTVALREAMQCDPVDLEVERGARVVVLAELPKSRQQRLELSLAVHKLGLGRPTWLADRLRRRLPSALERLNAALDPEQRKWRMLWPTIAEDGLYFMRRPVRAADRASTVVVLGAVVELPPNPAEDLEPAPPASDTEPPPEPGEPTPPVTGETPPATGETPPATGDTEPPPTGETPPATGETPPASEDPRPPVIEDPRPPSKFDWRRYAKLVAELPFKVGDSADFDERAAVTWLKASKVFLQAHSIVSGDERVARDMLVTLAGGVNDVLNRSLSAAEFVKASQDVVRQMTRLAQEHTRTLTVTTPRPGLLATLLEVRQPSAKASDRAREVVAATAGDPAIDKDVSRVVVNSVPAHDDVLWETLSKASKKGVLADFAARVNALEDRSGANVAAVVRELKLPPTLATKWQKLT